MQNEDCSKLQSIPNFSKIIKWSVMSNTIIIAGCLLLGMHHLYSAIKNKDKFTKSEYLCRLGIGGLMVILGITLLMK